MNKTVNIMSQSTIWLSILFFLLMVTLGSTFHCQNIPLSGMEGPRTPLEEEFRIVMSNINRTDTFTKYMPNTKYMLTIEGGENQDPQRKFMSFFIMVASENETLDSGSLAVIDDTLSKYSEKCENAIIETAKLPKESVSVIWNSPVEDSGCVRIRALVIETPETWYIEDDDGNDQLSVRMCPNPKAEEDDQGEILSECCACDEAKYEVSFEGLWSRNTHPKDFPSKAWLARFSDVIGASHTQNYRFWNYSGMASVGLKQVAEHGSTRVLESELKSQSEHIRTIIKARGISYPNVTGKTFAVFRVDRKHHLMSLVSMIDPSPDWFVGVSGLELCLPNCSWIEHKQFNLYPYDAGTDEGITYIAEDVPTDPQEPIRRITTSYPNDSRSPFYDPFNNDMKPMAKLYINRQRIYEKVCEEMPEGRSNSGGHNIEHKKKDRQSVSKACKMTKWGKWSPCSVTCGQGYKLRQRSFEDDWAAHTHKCNMSLSDRQQCFGIVGECEPSESRKNCELEPWSSWSECSATCAPAVKTRSRIYKHKQHAKYCRIGPRAPELQQTQPCELEPCQDCEGENCEEVSTVIEAPENETDETAPENYDDDVEEDNGGEELEEEVEVTEEWLEKCPKSRFSDWSNWSPCSSSCGPGMKLRSRRIEKNWNGVGEDWEEDDESLEECKVQQATCTANIVSCNFTKEDAQEICTEPKDKGKCSANIIRFYYDQEAKACKHFSYTGCEGNRNNFPTAKDCSDLCSGIETDGRKNHSNSTKKFEVSISSVLSYHVPVQEQRSAKTKRARSGMVETTPEAEFNGIQTGSQTIDSTEEYRGKVDCEFTDWSKWSECMDCNDYTYSIREITIRPQNGGKNCPKKLLRKKKCRKMPTCNLKRDSSLRRRSRDWDSVSNDYENLSEASVDCEMTTWSSWSRCTATCGESLQHRTRTFRVKPRRHGRLCPPLAEFRECTVPECY
ncbi:spondin-1-like isoform X3 [Belonocnema kinseyi]|uniref:spondin-1-like isoform X3 n=1 Tax=Belonocnema kinseyi TaxID=2817044 RepID=UPI00143DD4C7|nr:spondin-1-like isoform X3 [Belonocnema kinseyi]